MTDYQRLAAQLGVVRRAWKRKAALAGLAIVLLEALALFTLVFLVEWLYQPAVVLRTAMFVVAVAAMLVLVVRHVVAPLVRRIPDEQLALYVEEHRQDFQGALVTAAEFGRKPSDSPEQAGMVALAVDEAAARASRVNLPRLVHLRRLRKYGLAALILFGAYLALCVLFPETVSRRAVRVFTPWRVTPEDLASAGGAGPSARPFEEAMKQPITFALSRGDTRVPRGGELAVEAVLSRPSDQPVVLRFRPAGAPAGTGGPPPEGAGPGEKVPWRELAMKEIDKLNGFAAALKDVNEDLLFSVASGPYVSQAHRVTVYNPLALDGIQVTTRFPAYLKLADRIETSLSGDVAAPLGSTIVVRVLTNNPLAGGRLTWQDGAPQDLVVDARKTSAAASFEVRQDATYTFAVRDIDGQETGAAVPSYVRALKDQPPRIEVQWPRNDVTTHPLGQVTVVAEAADDWGVDALEFVYQTLSEQGEREVRVPLALKPQAPGGARPMGGPGGTGSTAAAAHVFALEDFRPRLAPGTMLTYYLEARDQKGQRAASDIYMVTVCPFEQWATWGIEIAEIGMSGGVVASPLGVIFAAAWHLHTQKDYLAPDEFNKQAEELAKVMCDPATGDVFPFVDLEKIAPEKLDMAKKIPPLAKKAHGALVQHDTAKALEHLRAAMAILTAIGLEPYPVQLALGGAAPGGGIKPEGGGLAQITFLEEASVEAQVDPRGSSGGEITLLEPGYKRELKKVEEAKKLQKQAEDLKKGQEDLTDRAVAMAGGEKPGEKSGQAAGDQKSGGGQPSGGAQKGGQKSGAKAGAKSGGQPAGGGEQAAGEGGEQSGGGQQSAGKSGSGQAGGDKTGGGGGKAGSAGALAGDQRKMAERTKAVAMDAKALGKVDAGFAKMGDKLDQAAAQMFAASARVQQGDIGEGVAGMKRAQSDILEAIKTVQGLQFASLEQGLDLAQAHAEKVLREQVEIRSRTRAVADKLTPGQKPDVGQQRDLKALAYRQGENRTGMEGLKQEIQTLRELAARGARPETTRGIEDAHRGVERHQIIQKMTNAAVELDGLRAAGAAEEEARAETGVQAVLDKLREAAGTLASDYKSELVRAKFEADRVAGALAKLSGKEEGGAQAGGEKAGGQAGGEKAGGQAGGEKAGGQAGGEKAGGQAGGDKAGGKAGGEKAGGQAGGEKAGGQAGDQPGGEGRGSPGAGSGGPAVAGGRAPLSPQERAETAQRAAGDLATLTRHLESRRLAQAEAGQLRKALDDPNVLAKVLASDEARREELRGVVRAVGNKLMAELDARLAAERLKDFQREECPPQYRPLVNKYYELLGQSTRE